MKPRTKVLPAICVNLCPSVANTLPIYAIMGPTASGKTALGVELARRVGGEVINCDSVQICRRTNVATAKPSDANWRVARRKVRGDRRPGGGRTDTRWRGWIYLPTNSFAHIVISAAELPRNYLCQSAA